ncbi:MAG: hypothetical protein OXC11_06190 [Rhodospirillales bacterium]|nr:hypothetical protein [Rhodospirillales bacterium]
MIRGFGCAALLATLLAAPSARGQEATCVTDPADDPVCEFRIHGAGDGASDLGVYNVALSLERLGAAVADEATFSIAIDAAECGQPLRRFVEEPARFTGEMTELRFNFPLFLHAAGRGGEYCVRVAASGCEGGCGGQVGLTVGDSAIMRMESDPHLR